MGVTLASQGSTIKLCGTLSRPEMETTTSACGPASRVLGSDAVSVSFGAGVLATIVTLCPPIVATGDCPTKLSPLPSTRTVLPLTLPAPSTCTSAPRSGTRAVSCAACQAITCGIGGTVTIVPETGGGAVGAISTSDTS